MADRTIAAWTEPKGHYPGYVNIRETPVGGVVITVRETGKEFTKLSAAVAWAIGSVTEIMLSPDEWQRFRADIARNG